MPEDEKEAGVETEEAPLEETQPEVIVENKNEKKETIKKIPKKAEGLIKRDIAFLQKKLAELEITISELQENVQKIDLSGLEEFKQRLEDVEDLSMVENAGVIELKKMLESIQSEIAVSHELGEKVSGLEQKIADLPDQSELPNSIQAVKDEFQNKLNEISAAISDLSGGLSHLSVAVPDLEKRLEGIDVGRLKEEVKNYVTPLIPGFANFDVVTRSLEDSITSVRQDVEKYKREVERIEQEIGEKVNSPLQADVLKGLEEVKNELLVNTANVRATDSFVQQLTQEVNSVVKEVNEIKPVVDKLNRFDIGRLKEEVKNYVTPLIPGFADLNEIKNNLESSISQLNITVESYKKEFGKLKQEVEDKLKAPLYTKLLKELEDVKNDSLVSNSKVDAIDSFAKELAREVGELRPLINRIDGKVTSFESLSDVEKAIDEKLREFRDLLSTAEIIKQSNQPIKDLDQVLSRVRDVERRLSEMQTFIREFESSKDAKWKIDYKKLFGDTDRELEKVKNELEAKISKELSEVLKSKITSQVQEIASSFDRKIEASDKLAKSLENDLSVLQGSVMALENRTSETAATNITNLIDRFKSLEADIENMKSSQIERMNQIVDRLNELEDKISPQPLTDELVDRLVFLESRLAALENVLNTGGSYPIVLE